MDVDYKNIPLDGVMDSPVDLRDYNYKDLSCNNNSPIPEMFEINYPFEPRNQLNTSTCAFQSVSAIIETINNVSNYVSDGFLNAMRDEYNCHLGKGAITREIMKLACESGIVYKSDFPNLEDYPTINSSFDNLNNKNELIEKAKQLKCQSYVRVDIEDVPSYLFNEKKPLVITTVLYDSFYKVNRPDTDGLVPYPSYGERCGNHAMVIIGYKYINGEVWLKILNSWGKYWCLNGYCWINAKDDKLINEIWGFTDIPKRITTTKYKIGWDKDKQSNKWIYSDNGKDLFINGWKEIKGEWYYFKNPFAIDGDWIFDNGWYYLEQGGCQMIKDSWQCINGDWYIFNEKGRMITGWYKDKNDNWFYLDNNGKMKTGWIFEGGKWYYLNPNSDGTKGKMIIGWLKDGEYWYYLDIDKGYCYTNCTILIDGKYYTFNEKGQWIEAQVNIKRQFINYNRSNRTQNIKYIVVHSTGNTSDTSQNNHDYFAGGNRGASADFFVDDNEIIQIIDSDNYYSWAVGDGHGAYGITNGNSVSIEMCGTDNGSISQLTIENTLKLVRYLMKEYNISKENVVRHYDASRKNCPSQFSPNNWSRWWNFKERI